MKEHELRELVNTLTKVARKHANSQQLRDNIASALVDGIVIPSEWATQGYINGFNNAWEAQQKKIDKLTAQICTINSGETVEIEVRVKRDK